MSLKQAARTVLHATGAIAALRATHRRCSRVLMFHAFAEADRDSLDALCAELARTFHPVTLTDIADAAQGRKTLPDYALTVTVDDAYRSYLTTAHAVFLRHKIPVTVYPVAGFSDGSLWLWPDQIEYALEHTRLLSLHAEVTPGNALNLDLSTPAARATAAGTLNEALKLAPDDARRKFVTGFGNLTGVQIPDSPPPHRAAMNWDELRAAAADGVEIGCHTQTHPILSRVASPLELDREIRGAKEAITARINRPVNHFCYPNGRAIDIGPAAAELVRKAGFITAATTAWGVNPVHADPLAIRRIPFASDTSAQYGAELLAGLHYTSTEL